MAQQRKSLRRKSLRHKNRTTLKRGGGKGTKSKSVKAAKTSHKNEPSSIVYFPRTGKRIHDDDETDDELGKEIKHQNSEENKARIKRYQQEQLDKHMFRIPGIIQTYGAEDIYWNIPNRKYIVLTNQNNQYYFDLLGISLKEACSITNQEVDAKYEDIINHDLLDSRLKKFVVDAKEKLRLKKERISYANEIPWQEYQLKVREYDESIMNEPNTYSKLPTPPPYEHETRC